jgi:pimeloyl-ACP methyl ester carboxylesterase
MTPIRADRYDARMSSLDLPLILLSGLAADASVFTPQRLAFPQLIVPPWIKPEPHETLSAYAARLAEQVRPAGPCVLGGASFGGMVALEMARFLQPQALLLIGSVRGPQELPRRVRIWQRFRSAIPFLPIAPLQWSAGSANVARRWLPHLAGVARQFSEADEQVFRWSLDQLLAWKTAPVVDCPIYQIHGDCDRVLPISRTRPDTTIRGGGHVISLTHAREVNDFIRQCLQRHATDPA